MSDETLSEGRFAGKIALVTGAPPASGLPWSGAWQPRDATR
jgi:hypothetical protein